MFVPIASRLEKASRYLPLAHSPWDRPSLALLGVARGQLSFLVRRFYPELVVRPAPLSGLRLAINPVDPTHVDIFNEVFLDQSYDLGLVPFTPDQIFDCGGHIGIFHY